MLRKVEYFVRVAETGSFSAVAKELGVGQPIVSKAVQALEAELGARLFNRSTRQLALTDAGEAAYQQGQQLLERYDAFLAVGQDDRVSARGTVSLSLPMALGTLNIIPRLRELQNAHPELLLNLRLTDSYDDLIAEGVDVALRVGKIEDSRLIAKPLGYIRRELVASNVYLAKHGEPASPADLSSHQCIVHGSAGARRSWFLSRGKKRTKVEVTGSLAVDSLLGVRAAVLADLGIAQLGSIVFADRRYEQLLTRILPDFECDSLPVNLVFQQNKFQPRRVRIVVSFLEEVFTQLL